MRQGWEGCGGKERMDEILLVIGKKGGRESERVKKLGKKWGVGRGGRSCNIFAVTLLYPGGRKE